MLHVVYLSFFFKLCSSVKVRESFVHSYGTISDTMCYFVLEGVAFCRRVLLRTCDPSVVPESLDIQPLVDLVNEDVLLDYGKTAVLEAELECYRDRFASSAEFVAFVGNNLYFTVIIEAEVFVVQGRSVCIDCSFTGVLYVCAWLS